LINRTIIKDTPFYESGFYHPEYNTINTKIPENIILADSSLTNSNKSKLFAEKAAGVIIDWRWGGFEIKKWMIKNYTNSSEVFDRIAPGIFEKSYINTVMNYGIDGSLKYSLMSKFKGKIIILINQFTQSGSEFKTMALKYGSNAILVGTNTAGADANIRYLNLPDKINICLTFYSLYHPDGTPQQMVGLKPDYVVKPTIKGIMEGRDEQLEFAIDLLRKKSELDGNNKK
jgi:C-terminal processing protease CtpA/Prc